MSSSRSRADGGVRVEAFLADSVSVDGGKLHTQGAGWNLLLAERIPTVHGRLGLALLMHVPAQDGAEHRLEVRLEDPAGDEIPLVVAPPDAPPSDRRIGGSFTLDPSPDSPLDEQLVASGINLDGIPFERTGRHRFVVAIDGADAAEVEFAVLPREEE
jgi:hypothetical protein